jgi:hypothetical protein
MLICRNANHLTALPSFYRHKSTTVVSQPPITTPQHNVIQVLEKHLFQHLLLVLLPTAATAYYVAVETVKAVQNIHVQPLATQSYWLTT